MSVRYPPSCSSRSPPSESESLEKKKRGSPPPPPTVGCLLSGGVGGRFPQKPQGFLRDLLRSDQHQGDPVPRSGAGTAVQDVRKTGGSRSRPRQAELRETVAQRERGSRRQVVPVGPGGGSPVLFVEDAVLQVQPGHGEAVEHRPASPRDGVRRELGPVPVHGLAPRQSGAFLVPQQRPAGDQNHDGVAPGRGRRRIRLARSVDVEVEGRIVFVVVIGSVRLSQDAPARFGPGPSFRREEHVVRVEILDGLVEGPVEGNDAAAEGELVVPVERIRQRWWRSRGRTGVVVPAAFRKKTFLGVGKIGVHDDQIGGEEFNAVVVIVVSAAVAVRPATGSRPRPDALVGHSQDGRVAPNLHPQVVQEGLEGSGHGPEAPDGGEDPGVFVGRVQLDGRQQPEDGRRRRPQDASSEQVGVPVGL
mmetsp:Transcript_10875/g.26134  ORF Transcript_10875/g.26134 Transcript_10875/m.26134 type:complete len:418 (+) Transcript_10875:132-1385(+)